MKAPILRAVYRNGNEAVHVDVHDIFSDRKFGSGMKVYDIKKHVNRGGKKYRFEKFIPAKGASIFRYTRRDLTTGLGKTETENLSGGS